MRSKLFASTLAIALGLATPVVSAIVFPDVVMAQTVEEKKKEADRLLKQGNIQLEANKHKEALSILRTFFSGNDRMRVSAF